jgi:hypothetical protein
MDEGEKADGRKEVGKNDRQIKICDWRRTGDDGTGFRRMSEWDKEVTGGMVTVDTVTDDNNIGRKGSTQGKLSNFDILHGVEIEEEEEELDMKLGESRKRKRHVDCSAQKKGLKGLPG